MDFTDKMQRQKMGFREYIEALEEERRKIEHFRRELPLCLELVTQTVEACRQQLSGTTTEYNLNGQSECSEQTSTEGPVLEEFIPIKKRASPDCEEDEEDEQHSHQGKIAKDINNTDKKKSDWLKSVQLWNPDPPVTEDVPRKASVVEVKGNGGAFHPFHREETGKKANGSAGKALSLTAVACTSSTVGAATGGNGGSNKNDDKEGQTQRKQRRCWSQELHKRFLQALQQLGGPDSATPKQIRELMKVDGLTNDEVKSHLQKFRLHTRRPSPLVNNTNPQAAPFVLVGNIFVQPPEVTTATTAPGGGIYAPVASHLPTAAALIQNPHLLEQSENSHSEERVNQSSEGAVHSNSPASSSSAHTATTSPGC